MVSQRISDIISKLNNSVEGIDDIILVNADGFIITTFSNKSTNEIESIAAYSAPVINNISILKDIFFYGQPVSTIMEFEKGIVIICGFNGKFFLLSLTSMKNNLGLLRNKSLEALFELSKCIA